MIASRQTQRNVFQQFRRLMSPVAAAIPLPPYAFSCEKVRRFAESQKKIAVLAGGNRSGKSYANVRKAVEFAVNKPGAVIWLLTINYKMQGGVLAPLVFKQLPAALIREVAWANYRLRIPDMIRLTNGTEMSFKTYDSKFEALQGAAVDLIILDEEPVDQNIYIECLARTLDKQGRISMSFTPLHGMSCWTYEKLFLAAQQGDPDIDFVTISLFDNPHIPQAEKDKIAVRYGSDEVARRIFGQFTMREGRVFKEFGEHNLIRRFSIPASWRRVRGIDFGYANPFVCLWAAIGNDGEIIIYQEYYQAEMLLKDHAAHIHDHDSEGVEPASWIHGIDWTVADHDAQDCAELWQYGIYTTNADKEVIAGIELVNRLLKPKPNGKPSLYIFDDLTHTKKEMGSYHYPPNNGKRNPSELPEKKDDHCCDVVRYICKELQGGSGADGIGSAGERTF